MTNATLVATITTKQDAQRAASDCQQSAHQDTIDAFFDDRENRELRRMMQSNSARFFS